MPRKRKPWCEKVGPWGATVTVEESPGWGGNVRLRAWDPELTGERKRSLKFKVRDAEGRLLDEAKEEALKQARALSNRLIAGDRPAERPPTTLGELVDRFQREVLEVSGLSAKHKTKTRKSLEAWCTYLGRRFVVERFTLREWNAFRLARETGEVDAAGTRVTDPKKRRRRNPWTAGGDLKALRQACRYGTRVREADGSFLLAVDPTRGIQVPTNPNPRRPVADDAMLAKLLEAAGKVQVRRGRGKKATYERAPLREVLILAGYTGRRISAVLGLKWSDWRPEEGTYGALRWRADTDKLGRETVVPVHPEVKEALETWQKERPGIGEGCVFPALKADGPVRVDVALRWLQRAATVAGLSWPERFGFHAFRRMFATKRKDLPVQDVAAAGGWKGTQVLRDLYQQADPETLEAVVMGGRSLRMSGTEQ